MSDLDKAREALIELIDCNTKSVVGFNDKYKSKWGEPLSIRTRQMDIFTILWNF